MTEQPRTVGYWTVVGSDLSQDQYMLIREQLPPEPEPGGMIVREGIKLYWTPIEARPAVASEGLRDDVRFALVEIIKWDATRKWPVVPTMLSEQARAALASAAGSVGALDVERLARALLIAMPTRYDTWGKPSLVAKNDAREVDRAYRKEAKAIAAAYQEQGDGE